MLFEKSWPIPVNPEVRQCECQTVEAKILSATIDSLVSEKESLVSTVSDLRQLLKRLALQQEREAQRRQEHFHQLEKEAKRLKLALEVSEKHSAHFTAISAYWGDFLEN